MAMEKLERVMWSLRKAFPNQKKISNLNLRRVIDVECGICTATYKRNRKALLRQGWIKIKGKKCFILTNKDLVSSNSPEFVIDKQPRAEEDVEEVEEANAEEREDNRSEEEKEADLIVNRL